MPFQAIKTSTLALLALMNIISFTSRSQTQVSSSSTSLTITQARDQNARLLEPGKPIEEELTGGQAHSYQLTIAAGQYLRIVVDPRGSGVAVSLVGPDGQKLVWISGRNGKVPHETNVFIADWVP